MQFYQTLYQSKRNRFKNWIGETKIFPYISIITGVSLVSIWLIFLYI